MPQVKAPYAFTQGLVDNPDKSTLRLGELTRATGCEYRLGTSGEIHKQPGRTRANSTALSEVMLGIHRLQYDTATDRFVAVTDGGKVYESDVGTSLTFGAAQVTGLSTTALPQFSSFSDRWIMCNGVDNNRIRESGNVPGTSSPWRTLGMAPAQGVTTATVNTSGVPTVARPSSDDANPGNTGYLNPNLAYDTTTDFIRTFAVGRTGPVGGTLISSHIWKITTNPGGGADRKLGITHSLFPIGSAFTSSQNQNPTGVSEPQTANLPFFGEVAVSARYQIEYATNGGSGSESYTSILDITTSSIHTKFTTEIPLDVTVNATTSQLWIRCTVTLISGGIFGASHRVFDIRYGTGSGTGTHDIEHGIYYFVTEKYVDSDGVEHESVATDTSPKVTGAGVYTITVTLPAAKTNSRATNYVVYRSIDEAGGGYPHMWQVGAPLTTETTWVDDLSLSITSTLDKERLYAVVTPLFADGSSLSFPANAPPPLSTMSLPYQGSVVYVPVDVPRRVWYSIPTGTGPAAAEQVPACYNLEFLTPQNDTVISGALANGGRSLIIYFTSYTMLVTYLPQASDPGRFDARVKEYVSDRRGAAGRFCATSFSPDDGASTMAAAVDSLGLWVTDGVGVLKNWSADLDWATYFAGVSLTTAQLIDNPELRRLEFAYNSTGTTWREFHFFYGEMKEGGLPKISGPHPAGYRCKHYANHSGTWLGWSGDKSSAGYVFTERQQASDAANGYDSNGTVPFDVEIGDVYPVGLDKHVLLTQLYPKFDADGTDKAVTIDVIFNRSNGQTTDYPLTVSKTFNTNTDKDVFARRLCDRFRVRVKDYTATAMPSVLGGEYVARPLSGGWQGG